ncbi:MAG TPA: tRNA (N6-threonylcarbamoyladenosine(37)-N6)-methyltransferase TrmO [Enhygromyxa sp.]|nr:tRNA (N6-threonylcarbamoyladenosine(37)-N6)-methyltransferase TrmO [Enhygromyxa sp.]
MTEPDKSFVIIGRVRSPWPEKFGVPRQSGLTRGLEGRIELDRELIPAEALRGLEGVSHVWILSYFHAAQARHAAAPAWRPTVRPPRLGGATRLGVFATRAPHRPNPIGLSLVRLLAVDDRTLRVADLDLVDGTPVLDIKPHLPWAEQPADARCEWAPSRPEPLAVRFAPAAEAALAEDVHGDALRTAIVETLRWDPRPAHQRDDHQRSFGLAVAGVELRFAVDDAGVVVLAITRPSRPR